MTEPEAAQVPEPAGWMEHLRLMLGLTLFTTLLGGGMFLVGGVLIIVAVGEGVPMLLNIVYSGAVWGALLGVVSSLVYLIGVLTRDPT